MTAVILGIGVGTGLLIAYAGWRPRAEPLPQALARLDRPPVRPAAATSSGELGWDARLGALALRRVTMLRHHIDRARRDLRRAGRSPEEQAARTVSYSGLGLLIGPWLGTVTWLAGAPFPPPVLGAVSIGGAGIGAIAPWSSVRTDATARHRDFLLALAAWCDLVSRCLASGRGVDQSVTTAARAGDGWAFSELRAALGAGSVRGQTPWASLDQLGNELGIEDLRELAATIAMAGDQGAAVRVAVATKARTIRERVTSDTERTAEAATAQMPMPTFLVAVGFLVFLGYPALAALSRSGF